MMVNAKTGKCLTIAGGVSTDNNVEAVQFDCDSDASRRWRLNGMAGGNVHQVKNVKTGKCLTIRLGLLTKRRRALASALGLAETNQLLLRTSDRPPL
jgi:cytolethal distending toxin subunit A